MPLIILGMVRWYGFNLLTMARRGAGICFAWLSHVGCGWFSMLSQKSATREQSWPSNEDWKKTDTGEGPPLCGKGSC